MGDVGRDIKGIVLPGKAYLYTFALLSIDVDINGESISVFQESEPSTTWCSRPVCECIADENHVFSLCLICRYIEEKTLQK